jgi:hypothetical protein
VRWTRSDKRCLKFLDDIECRAHFEVADPSETCVNGSIQLVQGPGKCIPRISTPTIPEESHAHQFLSTLVKTLIHILNKVVIYEPALIEVFAETLKAQLRLNYVGSAEKFMMCSSTFTNIHRTSSEESNLY